MRGSRAQWLPWVLSCLLVGCGACTRAPGAWHSINPLGAPSPRSLAAGQWAGDRWVVWGGSGLTSLDGLSGDGASYDPKLERWQALPAAAAPSARYLHTLTLLGDGRVAVWGGVGCPDLTSACEDGALFDPAAGNWAPLPDGGGLTPSRRSLHAAVWTGSELVIWGGQTPGGGVLADGAGYAPASGAWRSLSAAFAPSARRYHTATWTGTAILVWGGSGGVATDLPLADGAAWAPSTGVWTPLPGAGAPPGRWAHTAIWSGTELIVFGGLGCGTSAGHPRLCAAGARYAPASGLWRPVSSAGAPSARSGHSSVWTGAEMIIWGGASDSCGDGGSGLCSDGAAYDPATDRWRPLPRAGAVARAGHLAAWTGAEMLVWGGQSESGAESLGEIYRP